MIRRRSAATILSERKGVGGNWKRERERERERTTRERMKRERMKREEENKERERWQPGGGGKNKKCHLSGNAEVVPVSEPSKKVVPLFEREKRSCQYLIITLKVVPL